MQEEYVVDLEKVCRCYDEEYEPSYVAKLPEEERSRHRFVIRAASEGDVIAALDMEQSLAKEAAESLSGVGRAEVDGEGRIRVAVRADMALMHWYLRRLVAPPAGYRKYWAEGEPDPMLDALFPRELKKELFRVAFTKLHRSAFLLPEAPVAVERAAGKR